MINLRPYQLEIIDQTRRHMLAGHKSILIQAPTGSGKTALTAHMLATAAKRGKRCWFVVHRRELIKQAVKAFGDINIKVGVVSAGWHPEYHLPIQVCSINSLSRRLHKLKTPDLIVCDEAHHAVSATWTKVLNQFNRAYKIGLTATPQRLDGRGLSDHFAQMVQGPTTAQLIEQGYLAPYDYYAPPISITGLRTKMGDYDRKQTAEAMDKPTITGDAVAHYQEICPSKRAVAFAASIDHSRHIVGYFRAAGITAEHVDGSTPTQQRDGAIKRFTTGQTLILSNVDLFGEGFDLPAIEASILLRPTQSLALFLQQVGRSLRPSPGKDRAVILDHAGNVMRHGLPDADRDWSLESKARNKREVTNTPPAVRTCPKCFAAISPTPKCPQCGYLFEPEPREVKEVAGSLKKITAEQKKAMQKQRRKEQSSARTLKELIQLGISRGYKKPEGWAKHIYYSRPHYMRA